MVLIGHELLWPAATVPYLQKASSAEPANPELHNVLAQSCLWMRCCFGDRRARTGSLTGKKYGDIGIGVLHLSSPRHVFLVQKNID